MADPKITLGGLELFGTDAFGVEWLVPKNGADWWSGADSTIDVKPNVGASGGWSAKAYIAPKVYTLTGYALGATTADVSRAIDRLWGVVSPDGADLVVEEDAYTRTSHVRRATTAPEVTWVNGKVAQWEIGLVALDPRRYGAALSQSTALPAASASWTIPLVLPATITSTRLSGRVSLTNTGNVDAPVTVRFYGPTSGDLIGPMVTHVQSGARVSLPSLAVLPGERVDVVDGRALADGVAGRDGYLVENDPLILPPGTHDFQFEAASSGPGSSMTVESWEAWE